MAGLSMGAMQTNTCVMKHPEFFANAGIFSGGFNMTGEGFDMTEAFEDPKKYKEIFDVLFISSGEQEQPMCDRLRSQLGELNAKGIDARFHSCPGYHEWDVWRNAAKDFLQLLFR
jgi:enterochelin esterase-like enzyme